jgi:hypothetical protein
VRLALIALLFAGCGTRVLELAPDAGPPPFPAPFCLKDPVASCDRCYDQWGTPTKNGCTDAAAPAACYTKPDPATTRCLYCGSEQRACLKCAGMPAGANCATCAWSDNGALCMICYDASGTVVKDGCDPVRLELKN